MAEVSEVVEFSEADCDFHTQDEHRWLLVQAGNMTRIGERYHMIVPNHVIAFSAWPGDECEMMNLGLAFYPKKFETDEGTLRAGEIIDTLAVKIIDGRFRCQ